MRKLTYLTPIIAILLALLILSACQAPPAPSAAQAPTPPQASPEPPAGTLSAADLAGIWRNDDGGPYLQLNADGTFRAADAMPWIESHPVDVGQFRLEGTAFAFNSTGASPNCPSQKGAYQVKLTEDGKLQFTLEQDACTVRTTVVPFATWSRTSQ